MNRITTVLLSAFSVSASFPQLSSPHGVSPKQEFVPTATVALAIAEAVLTPVYGKQVILSERAFHAKLKENVWTVTGSVPCNGPPGAICPGGAAEVRISKKTGQILFMAHYQ